MSGKDSIPSARHCTVESGLTQVIPFVLCMPEKDIKAPKTGSDIHLSVPHTASSKIAKMKKKIHSPLSRRKGSSSESSEALVSTGKIFGISLEESVKQSEGPPIPWVVVRIVEYLDKYGLKNEGIFRVNGNKKNADMMKTAFDRDNDADLEEIGDVMAVAGLLKQYLRDLPEPPVPQSLTQEFIRIHTDYGDNDSSECLDELKDLLRSLPMLNYQLVKYLCEFLVKVTQYEGNNKMSAMALAIVFGPNFFRCKDGLEGLKEQGHTNAIVCKFLQQYDTLFPDNNEVSPYATTDIFTTPRSPDSTVGSDSKVHERSASDEETSNKTTVEITVGKPEPVYAYIDKHKKQLAPSTSSSSEELDLYVRSVSPSLWSSNGNTNGNSSHSCAAHPHHHGPPSRDFVQSIIKDSIKEHLFGPDVVSTDDNECSPNESELSRVHSAESLEEIVPPLPARNYGPEDTNRPQPKRRRNAKKQKQLQDETICESAATTKTSQDNINTNSKSVLMVNMPAMDNKELVITLDQNSNSIVELKKKDGVSSQLQGDKMDEDFGILTTLTKHRATLPSNRHSPTLKKRNPHSDVDEEEETLDECGELPKTFVHPLVEEAKSRGKISTPPPRSPRSSPRVPMSPPSPLSPNKHATVDEVDGGYNPVKELMTRQHKKRGRGVSAVPPLELYKLQQGEGDENLIKHDVQLSPRERYDGFSTDEALLSPRSRPLSIDTKSYYSTECPPSPPHDHIEPFWSDRRMESPKGELSIKQISRNIHLLKKKIRDFEEDFEAEHDHKPSQSEKAPIKKYLTDLTRYRKDLKELKEKAKEDSERLIETVPSTKQELMNSTAEPLLTTTPATVQHSLDNILRKLQEKRKAVGRSEDLQSLTLEELQDEKLCVQKALLQHESVFGRPTSKKDKDIMRPLYDRYRLIKRKLSASRTQSSIEDLSSKTGGQDTLIEDMGSEEQLFATPTLLPISKLSPLSKDLSKAQKRHSDASAGSIDDLDNCSDFGGSQETLLEDKECDAKLHHMTPEELQKQSELAKREKKRLRKKLKKFEDDFLERTGRRVQRDERGEMENDYREYKEIKARLRLIDVLLNKRQASQTI